jgi:hypothetical protein
MSRQVKRVRPRMFAIFHAVKVDARSQRDVAREFEISQPRVSQAVKAVTEYLSEVVPDDVQGVESLPEMPRRERLYAGMRLQKMRLEQGYVDMMRAWQASRDVSTTIKVIETSQGERKETTTKTRDGNVRFHRTAMDYSAELLELEGMMSDGSVNLSNDGRLKEIPSLTLDEQAKVQEICRIALKSQAANAQADARRERARQRRQAAAGVPAGEAAVAGAAVAAEPAAEVAAEVPAEVSAAGMQETAALAEVATPRPEGGLSLNEAGAVDNGDIYRENQGMLPVANDDAALIAPVGKPTESANVNDKVLGKEPETNSRDYPDMPGSSEKPTEQVTKISAKRPGERVPSRDLLSVPFDELSEADFDRMIARAQRAEWLRRWTTREITVKEGRLASRRDDEW